MNLEISYFDPTKMSHTATILLIGRRGSGKSTVAADIMSHHAHISEGICISPTDNMTNFWRTHIPPLFIHHDYNASVTEEFLKHQHNKWMKYKTACKKAGVLAEEGRVDPAFVIFDDVTYDKTFFKSKLTRQLMMNGRHYSTFVLITSQYAMDVPSDIRGQIDYVFLLKEPNRANRERLHAYFAGMFPSFHAFEEALRCCTENREVMVIDNTKQSYNVNECVFFYKATPNIPFKMGSEEYWRFGTEQYESEDEEGEENEDDADAIARKYYDAGKSKKEQERSKQFRVHKVYPTEFKPHVASDYALAYRSTTVPQPPPLALPPPVQTSVLAKYKKKSRNLKPRRKKQS